MHKNKERRRINTSVGDFLTLVSGRVHSALSENYTSGKTCIHVYGDEMLIHHCVHYIIPNIYIFNTLSKDFRNTADMKKCI